MSKKKEWSEICFSSSEITYYDLIVKEKDLNSIEKISDQISNVIAGGESDSTAHLVLGNLGRLEDKFLSSNYVSIESSDIDSFDYTIENNGKLVKTPEKGEVVLLFYYRYDHADYVLTKNENFTNVCFKVKSFKKDAVMIEMDYPGFELTANDASGGGEMYLEIICNNGLSFEGSVEFKDDLIKEFHTYLSGKQKKTSKEKDKNYLIKISPYFLFSEIDSWDDDEGLDKDGIPTQKASDYCIDRMRGFIDELKEKVDGAFGEKILISDNSKDFHELSKLKNTIKFNYEDLNIYILLTKEILGEELNSIFLSMSEYGFGASYQNNEGEIVTQGYDAGEYDTGYFAATIGNWECDAEQYISNVSNPMSLSLEKYKEVIKILLE